MCSGGGLRSPGDSGTVEGWVWTRQAPGRSPAFDAGVGWGCVHERVGRAPVAGGRRVATSWTLLTWAGWTRRAPLPSRSAPVPVERPSSDPRADSGRWSGSAANLSPASAPPSPSAPIGRPGPQQSSTGPGDLPAQPAVNTSRAPRTPSFLTARGLTTPDMTGSPATKPGSALPEHTYDTCDPRKQQESRFASRSLGGSGEDGGGGRQRSSRMPPAGPAGSGCSRRPSSGTGSSGPRRRAHCLTMALQGPRMFVQLMPNRGEKP